MICIDSCSGYRVSSASFSKFRGMFVNIQLGKSPGSEARMSRYGAIRPFGGTEVMIIRERYQSLYLCTFPILLVINLVQASYAGATTVKFAHCDLNSHLLPLARRHTTPRCPERQVQASAVSPLVSPRAAFILSPKRRSGQHAGPSLPGSSS
jgi:hypothetical protein